MADADREASRSGGLSAGQPSSEDLAEELAERFTGDETDAPTTEGGAGYAEGEAPPLEYSKLDRGFTRFSRWCSYLAAVALLIVTVVAFVDVVLAKFFGHSIPGQFDLIANLNLVMVFLAAFYVQMDRGSVSIELLQDRFSNPAKFGTRVFGSLLGAASCFFCAYRGWYYLADFYTSQKAATGLWKFPIWPFQSVLVFGFFCLGVAFLFTIAREVTNLRLKRGRYAPKQPKPGAPLAPGSSAGR
jgi:TRAP-type C4-dicarboxylate transport system permease small subunit